MVSTSSAGCGNRVRIETHLDLVEPFALESHLMDQVTGRGAQAGGCHLRRQGPSLEQSDCVRIGSVARISSGSPDQVLGQG